MKYASDEIEWLVFSGKRKEELSTASKNFTTFNEQNFSTKWLRHSVCELLIIYCSEIDDWKTVFFHFNISVQNQLTNIIDIYEKPLFENRRPQRSGHCPKSFCPSPQTTMPTYRWGAFFIKVLPYGPHDDVVILRGYSEFQYFARK